MLAANLCLSRTEATLAMALVAVPVGMAIGAATSPGEKWTTTSLPQLSVGLGPAPGGGVAARVAVAF